MNPWPRLDAWLSTNARPVFDALRAPLDSPAPVETLASRIEPIRVPAGLLDLWHAHDGAMDEHPTILSVVSVPKAAGWIRGFFFLSADQARKSHFAMLDLGIGWHVCDLPIAEDGGGNVLSVDARTEEVWLWDHETTERLVVAQNLNAWLGELVARMEAGRIELAEWELAEVEVLQESGPRIELPADHGARMLLKLLLDRELVLLTGTATQSLLSALHVALQRPQSNRNDAVRLVLETHDSIDDYFLDDDSIAALAREFGA